MGVGVGSSFFGSSFLVSISGFFGSTPKVKLGIGAIPEIEAVDPNGASNGFVSSFFSSFFSSTIFVSFEGN